MFGKRLTENRLKFGVFLFVFPAIHWYVIAAVGFVLLLITAASVIRWRKTKGKNIKS